MRSRGLGLVGLLIAGGSSYRYIVEVDQSFPDPYLVRPGAATLAGHRHGGYHKAFNCSDVFAGIVIESPNSNLDSLRHVDGFVDAWPARTVPMAPVVRHMRSEAIEQGGQPLNYSIHRWTGVDKLHSAGIRGKGVKVAVVDTGVDYTHEALGGCFGAGCRISGGYDLVGGRWAPNASKDRPKVPDGDPMDYNGHGTHVAGIIAAKADWFTAVAPEAELLAYRVFPDEASFGTTEDVLIQAFCDAYSAGADVITSSINIDDGFADGAWARVATRLVDRGLVVTISAGNTGSDGPFGAGSGSNGPGVLSVAAINVTADPNTDMADPRARPKAAEFTSWGPTNELLVKPDVGAPGVGVVSTIPGHGFDVMDGTSMAAPYVAGIAALFISAHGGRAVHGPGLGHRLARRFVSSGRSVAWATGWGNFSGTAPPFQVGTGLVDAVKVLNYSTDLAFDSISLLDTELFQSRWSVDIANTERVAVNYTFSLESQSAVEIYNGHDGIRRLPQLGPLAIVPNVSLPPSLAVLPGEKKTASFAFSLPNVTHDDLLPLYGGKIWIKESNGEELCIPYGGATYDTEKAFDSMFQVNPWISGNRKTWTWSFNTTRNWSDYVNLSAILSYPCVHLRWDIFKSNWTEYDWEYPPEVGKAGYIGSATSFRLADKFDHYLPFINDKDGTVAFPMMRVPRGKSSFWWFGRLANGTQIAPGTYTMRFAALRPYGNPSLSDHWDIMHLDERLFHVLPQDNGTNSTLGAHSYEPASLHRQH